ncbi:Ltp family lipoprotein [uncultured Clostridium sp.]|uniref:Ltp family lipoprotein n=1 Tax=uncultured Clostridium sp. TaxID=59620 RepID=UPI0028E95FE8|nr:Ltp family lipoprotein [uncultured Clostridium sp.]
MSKMIKCKTCGKEIDKNAKTCPSCGEKNKKPIFKRWWFILIVLVVIIGALASGGNKGKNTTDESQETTNTSTVNANKDESKQEKAKDTTKENIPKEYQSALKKADSYANIMNFSKKGLYQQLTSDAGEKFTEEEAQYAVNNLEN